MISTRKLKIPSDTKTDAALAGTARVTLITITSSHHGKYENKIVSYDSKSLRTKWSYKIPIGSQFQDIQLEEFIHSFNTCTIWHLIDYLLCIQSNIDWSNSWFFLYVFICIDLHCFSYGGHLQAAWYPPTDWKLWRIHSKK